MLLKSSILTSYYPLLRIGRDTTTSIFLFVSRGESYHGGLQNIMRRSTNGSAHSLSSHGSHPLEEGLRGRGVVVGLMPPSRELQTLQAIFKIAPQTLSTAEVNANVNLS